MPSQSERDVRARSGRTQAARQTGAGGSASRPGDARADTVNYLQRTFGNRAVQRLLEGAADAGASDDIGQQIRSASSGAPLEGTVQRALEQHLGTDLSGVRVHTDARADMLARQVEATAFTSGSDIFFRAGAYSPGTADGRHTLAHEAVHVVQQAAGPVAGTPVDGGISLSDPGDTFERAAESTASSIRFE